MTLRAMMERRSAIVLEMRSLADTDDHTPLNAEQEARFSELKAELAKLEARMARQVELDEAERRAQGQPAGGTGDARLDELRAGIGILDVVRAAMGGTDRTAGRAREASQEAERRSGRRAEGMFWNMEQRDVLGTATPASGPGGALIGTEHRPDLFIDRLRNATRVRALGATVLAGLTGNISIPRRSASTTAGWVAENTPLPNGAPGFDSVTLNPKHAGAITEWSRNMLLQSSPDVEQLARSDLSMTLAEALDAAAIMGSGQGAEPRGILNTPGIGAVVMGTNGGPITFDALADLQGQVDDANAGEGSMGFLTNSKVRRAAAKVKDSQGRPLGLDVMFQGMTPTISNIVPSDLTKGTGTALSPVIYGNFADLLIGIWSELDILVNPFEGGAYNRGNVQIRAMLTVDIAVRHPQSFAAIRDIAA